MHYMVVTGFDTWTLYGMLGTRSETRVIEYDHELAELIIEETRRFWEEHVLTREPPEEPDGYMAMARNKIMFPSSDGNMLEPTEEAIELAALAAKEKALIELHSEEYERLESELTLIIREKDGIKELCTWKRNKAGHRVFHLDKKIKKTAREAIEE